MRYHDYVCCCDVTACRMLGRLNGSLISVSHLLCPIIIIRANSVVYYSYVCYQCHTCFRYVTFGFSLNCELCTVYAGLGLCYAVLIDLPYWACVILFVWCVLN